MSELEKHAGDDDCHMLWLLRKSRGTGRGNRGGIWTWVTWVEENFLLLYNIAESSP